MGCLSFDSIFDPRVSKNSLKLSQCSWVDGVVDRLNTFVLGTLFLKVCGVLPDLFSIINSICANIFLNMKNTFSKVMLLRR